MREKADRFMDESGSEERQVPGTRPVWEQGTFLHSGLQAFVPGEERAGARNGRGRLEIRAALSDFTRPGGGVWT